jgi:hypothetical protein
MIAARPQREGPVHRRQDGKGERPIRKTAASPEFTGAVIPEGAPARTSMPETPGNGVSGIARTLWIGASRVGLRPGRSIRWPLWSGGVLPKGLLPGTSAKRRSPGNGPRVTTWVHARYRVVTKVRAPSGHEQGGSPRAVGAARVLSKRAQEMPVAAAPHTRGKYRVGTSSTALFGGLGGIFTPRPPVPYRKRGSLALDSGGGKDHVRMNVHSHSCHDSRSASFPARGRCDLRSPRPHP